MYDWQANAFLLRPGRVLDKQLQPFTVGHAFLLESINSPYFVGGPRKTEDLLIAVILCSMAFPEACKFLTQPPTNIEKQCRKWGKAISKTRCNIEFDAAQFERYIQEYNKMPEAWIDPDPVAGMKRRDSAYPLALRIAWTLMAHGLSEDSAYNMPMNRALEYYGIESERNGQEYVTADQDQLIDEIPESANGNG